jgi:hypothetical protein
MFNRCESCRCTATCVYADYPKWALFSFLWVKREGICNNTAPFLLLSYSPPPPPPTSTPLFPLPSSFYFSSSLLHAHSLYSFSRSHFVFILWRAYFGKRTMLFLCRLLGSPITDITDGTVCPPSFSLPESFFSLHSLLRQCDGVRGGGIRRYLPINIFSKKGSVCMSANESLKWGGGGG